METKYSCYGASVMDVLRALQSIVARNPHIDFERVRIECNEYAVGDPCFDEHSYCGPLVTI